MPNYAVSALVACCVAAAIVVAVYQVTTRAHSNESGLHAFGETKFRRDPGDSCSAVDSWPTTASGVTQGLACADDETGYLYRECLDGVWGDVVGMCTANSACPINCAWHWSDWTDCQIVSGIRMGLSFRFPVLDSKELCGGTCDLPTEQYRDCTIEACLAAWIPNDSLSASVRAGGPGVGYSSEEPGQEASLILDGDVKTWWKSSSVQDGWVQIDLGVERTLMGFEVWPKEGRAQQINFQVWDDTGLDWDTVDTINVPDGTVDGVTNIDTTFDEIQGRFWRVMIPESHGVGFVGLNELKMKAWDTTVGNCYIATGDTETPEPSSEPCNRDDWIDHSYVAVTKFSSQEVMPLEMPPRDNKAMYVGDGKWETQWSAESDENEWIVFDLGTSYDISVIRIVKPTKRVKQYVLEGRLSTGDAWAVVHKGTSGLVKEEDISFPVFTAQWLRFTVVDTYGNSHAGAREISFYGRDSSFNECP